ncbi:c-type cytochrome [Acidisoma cellulosilytica]|uniref:C-type cytochrome n=1 Tax=Acidisoma cellulosilyticum TaxID=2802395 RepID=A0A963YYF4_9PROT|nr:c-type cytochrome [Acidisoma cellulosilyticum]MCB8879439.1 c-type cytochrome [Acidisoma cellulosilyticum]
MKLSFLLSALLTAGLGFATTAFAQDDSLVAQGKYLATAGDCAACHTSDGGKPFAGGLAIATPIGNIVASNITPSKTDGIGDYSEAEFARAVREGVRRDGANLYPAMPYTAYAKISDADIHALYTYLMQGVQPVDVAAPETKLPFPFSIRASMWGWNLLFLDDTRFTPDPARDAAWNRGAYLAEGLEHCSTCHTPRNFLMAEKSGDALSGASLGTWYAPNITSDPVHGIGGWSVDDIATYLSTGRSDHGSEAGGPMLEAINKSLSHLSPGDIHALATYIHSIAAKAGQVAPGDTAQAAPLDDDVALMNGTASAGANLYADHCSTCHQAGGEGGNGLPALLGNAALRRPVADNVAMAILEGLTPRDGLANSQAMPGFGQVMDDSQVATLTNYLFAKLGDAGVQITPARVAALRAGGAPSPLLALARDGMIAAAVVVVLVILALLIWLLRRRRAA